MIKIIVHITKAVVAVVMSLLFFSCNFAGVDGNGKVTNQNRPVNGAITSVSASGGIEVIIEQGSQTSVVVEADENLQEHIKTEVSNGELKISCDVNIRDAKANRVIVQLSDIKEIEADGGSSVTSKGTIKGDSMKFSSGGGASLQISADARNINADASGGGSLELAGQTENLETESSSGGSINAEKLSAKKVKASASSGGSTTVNPIENLSADASSGGNVYYTNTPEKLTKDEDSGGSVSQAK